MRFFNRHLLLLFAGAVLCLQPLRTAAQDANPVEHGKAVYDKYCYVCHGEKGDGKGLMGIIHRAQKNGMVVYTYPRDFTGGMYKFRSTSSGYLPTDEDLMKTITNGIPRSGMPSHKDLTVEERSAVIAFIKTYSKRWTEEKPGKLIMFGETPDYIGTKASIERGRVLYIEDMQCNKCHGDTGMGDGPSAEGLKDAWGDKIMPFDFTSGPLKGGTKPLDIYRTFVTGLDGTPMPSYEESLSGQRAWDLVSFCQQLMKGEKHVAEK